VTARGGKYGGRKVREGTVVSDKMQKTVVVAVESHFRHPLYKKSVRRIRRFMAHDEAEESHLGDRVRIVESRPISRRKRWRVVEVLAKAELPEVAAASIDLELLGEVKPEEAPAPAPEPAAVPAEPAPAVADDPGQGAAIEAVAPAAPASEEAPAGEAPSEGAEGVAGAEATLAGGEVATDQAAAGAGETEAQEGEG